MTGELWIALVGVIVTGLTSAFALWITHQERKSTYRQTLYTKQIEGYQEILDAASVLRGDATYFAYILMHDSNQENIKTWYKELIESENIYRKIVQKWTVLLPDRIQNRLALFVGSLIDLLFYEFSGIDADGNLIRATISEVHIEKINKSYNELIATMREQVGTDPLSQETLRLIGKVQQDSRKLEQAQKA